MKRWQQQAKAGGVRLFAFISLLNTSLYTSISVLIQKAAILNNVNWGIVMQ